MKKKVLVIVANSFPFYCSIAKHIELDHLELGDNVEVFNYEKLFGGWPYNFSIKEKIYNFLFSNNFNKLFKNSNIINFKYKKKHKFKYPDLVNDLIKLKIDGVNIGLATLTSSVMMSGIPNPTRCSEMGKYYYKSFDDSLMALEIAKKILLKNYDKIYIWNGRLSFTRPIFEFLKNKSKINIFETGRDRLHFMLYDNFPQNNLYISQLIEKHNSDNLIDDARKFYEGRRNRIEDFDEAHSKIQTIGEGVKFNNNKKLLVYFTSSESERTGLFDNNNIGNFASQMDVVRNIHKFLDKNKYFLVVKFHPGQGKHHKVWKKLWDFEFLNKEHIQYLLPDNKIDTYKVIDQSYCVITCGSTVGIESVYWNKKCINIGNSRYMTLNSSINVNNYTELKDALNNIEQISISREGALKYGSFHTNLGTRVRNLELDSDKLYKYDNKYFNPYSLFKTKIKKSLNV